MSSQSKEEKSSRTYVVNPHDGSCVPFLRGILTSSLQDAGLEFEPAYKLAAHIRRELSNRGEISNTELRNLVAEHLEKEYGDEVRARYVTPLRAPFPIVVHDTQGKADVFSLERLSRALESAALPTDVASDLAAQIHSGLIDRKISDLSSQELSRITYQHLLGDMGPEVARRYLVWLEYARSGRPLMLLIGGTNGCGKSTVASELAHRLNIVRTQSTDMLREVMRKTVAKRLLPVIHTSSFKAWETLPNLYEDDDHERRLIDGFLNQSEHIALACNGALRRAMNERASMILEGIHIHPRFQSHVTRDDDVIVVPVMLAALKPEQLKKQISGRGDLQPTRRAARYLSHFNDIWALQSFLLSEADRFDVPIIANQGLPKMIEQVMQHVMKVLMQSFPGDPSTVFPAQEAQPSA